MPNPQQMRRAAEVAHAMPQPRPGQQGYWISGTKLDIAGVTYPRGSTVPDAIVGAFKPDRLAVLISTGYLAFRFGVPHPDAPKPSRPRREDPQAVATAQRAAMLRDGYALWEIDAAHRPPPGAYREVNHPATAVKPGSHRTGGPT